ncbi:photosynthetic reaction center cytochrome PufC [Methylocella silvestris]|uniref:Photosynthetic reaction center cytochrome c subunit n=1 Tax=Methylocella silvestris TaxID=199596 RepID=A0A2J7TDH7_METSI|nr:photosynthetic reaction center cytochrome PufC [Methylocella silvestris]PNG24799.1 photosynthetic reaction center cytochrome c subunit [Methylocella silvestris]
MKTTALLSTAALTICLSLGLGGCKEDRLTVKQTGYRGLGMVQINETAALDAITARNQPPDPIDPVEKSGTPSSQVYQNVKVLGDLDSNELMRLMTAITQWVAPEQGCNYCHNPENLASDDLYTKVVARRMIQMTQHINADWTKHVDGVGVTCYTCHRGHPVPANLWFSNSVAEAHGFFGYSPDAKNHPGSLIGLASLQNDPFTKLLDYSQEIRVIGNTALPQEPERPSIKQTELTYGLMMHISKALGVNCTFCHNSRSFFAWDQSTPQRATAWYGIRMVRDLNHNFLEPLKASFPPERLGAGGDVPKINCATCHQGESKPLNGASMIKDFPELAVVGK